MQCTAKDASGRCTFDSIEGTNLCQMHFNLVYDKKEFTEVHVSLNLLLKIKGDRADEKSVFSILRSILKGYGYQVTKLKYL